VIRALLKIVIACQRILGEEEEIKRTERPEPLLSTAAEGPGLPLSLEEI
jgi:hypothetical protein